MRSALLLGLIASALSGPAAACTCARAAPEDDARWLQDWQLADAVVLAEVLSQTTEPATPWLSRRHVLGLDSPRRRQPLLSLRVVQAWRGDLVAGATFTVAEKESSACGYTAWQAQPTHLLYLRKGRYWLAGLCTPSRPVSDPTEALQKMDADIARHLMAPARASRAAAPTPSPAPRPALPVP